MLTPYGGSNPQPLICEFPALSTLVDLGSLPSAGTCLPNGSRLMWSLVGRGNLINLTYINKNWWFKDFGLYLFDQLEQRFQSAHEAFFSFFNLFVGCWIIVKNQCMDHQNYNEIGFWTFIAFYYQIIILLILATL